jgi:hypothetical protein
MSNGDATEPLQILRRERQASGRATGAAEEGAFRNRDIDDATAVEDGKTEGPQARSFRDAFHLFGDD